MPESTNIGAFRTKAKIDSITAVLSQSSDAENPPQNLETHENPKWPVNPPELTAARRGALAARLIGRDRIGSAIAARVAVARTDGCQALRQNGELHAYGRAWTFGSDWSSQDLVDTR